MAKLRQPAHLKRLLDALKEGLLQGGITATIAAEAISRTKLHRVIVLTDQFEALPPSERQSLVWRIADGVLSFDEKLLISSILTLTPEEAGLADRPAPRRQVARSRQR